MEDGVHMAMPYDVHVIFSHFLLGRIDDPCVHTADTRGELEYRC